jgi:hypothetical protein
LTSPVSAAAPVHAWPCSRGASIRLGDGTSRIFEPRHTVVGETALGGVGSVAGDQVLKRVEQVLCGKAKSQVVVKLADHFAATA